MTEAPLLISLVGPAGEPVDFRRTISGHGVTSLAPMAVDDRAGTLRITLNTQTGGPRTVVVRATESSAATVDVIGPPPTADVAAALLAGVRHILRLDQDLSGFYAVAARDPALAWAISGAGRMTRCQTVFEDVVKTVCTTNCAWSATVRMVNALVAHLGEPAPEAPENGCEGRAFPTPEALANASDAFYRETVRCGYRGPYLRKLATMVVDGVVDLEALGRASEADLPDDDLAKRLMELPGVGPYAAAHIMMMLGRYSRLIFDSWTRPTYARLIEQSSVTDTEIADRFAPYGRYAGLAFWLTITQGWVEPGPASSAEQSADPICSLDATTR